LVERLEAGAPGTITLLDEFADLHALPLDHVVRASRRAARKTRGLVEVYVIDNRPVLRRVLYR